MNALIALADRERVLSALHEAIASCASHVPKPYRAVLATHYEANRRRNAAIRQAVFELGEAARGIGLELAALKGAAWILEDSSCAAWRQMIDVDVLVDPRQFGKVPQLLESLGCERAVESRRFDVNFHHAPYTYPGGDFTIEVHRHLGWKHALLPPDAVLARARRVASGLLLPAPWCRAFHTIIHWQVQDCGFQRRSIRLKDMLDLARIMARNDVDWAELAAHARAVGALDACAAAMGLASALLAAPVPREIIIGRRGARHVAQALACRASPLQTWLATQIWRAGTLWRCEKVAYRASIGGASPPLVRATVWANRMVRLPILAVRAVGIVVRAVTLWLRGATLPRSAS